MAADPGVAIARGELPAAPELIYPAVLRAIRELMLVSQPNNPWLQTVESDIKVFAESRQISPTLFYTNMGTLPDDGVRARPEQQVWVDAGVNTLIWLGQVAGNRIDTERTYGMPLFAAFCVAAACSNCKREFMARGWVGWAAAQAWAHDAVPRLLVEAGAETVARRIVGAASDPEPQEVLSDVDRLFRSQGIEITEKNLIKWPRAACPACGTIMRNHAWSIEGRPPRLVSGVFED